MDSGPPLTFLVAAIPFVLQVASRSAWLSIRGPEVDWTIPKFSIHVQVPSPWYDLVPGPMMLLAGFGSTRVQV